MNSKTWTIIASLGLTVLVGVGTVVGGEQTPLSSKPVRAEQTSVAASTAASVPSPNILVIYVDDMGYGDLGCYGSKTKTPKIDQFAAEGTRFTNYLSAANVCSPSRAALLTGRYPTRCGLPVCPNGKEPLWNEHVGLPPDEITIAELLRGQGYATAAFGKWHLGDLKPYGPREQGFDEYQGALYNFPVGKKSVWLDNEQPRDKIRFADAHQRLTDATISFMKKQQAAEKPFFIYLSHYLVHGPWSPNEKFCTPEEWQSVKKKKGKMNPKALPAMVRELDHHVGLVLQSLKDLGIENETMVVLASDNGPWLPAGSAKPFTAGKYTTMEGGHRVPAIVRWPGHVTAGKVSDEMVSALDILPTIATASGAALPTDRKYDGFDLLPLLSGETTQSPRDHFVYYNGLRLEAVRQGPWKLHLPRQASSAVYWQKTPKGGYLELDHPILNRLSDDPAEQTDLATEYQDKVTGLESFANQTRKELGDWNQNGIDRHAITYPGDLQHKQKPSKRKSKPVIDGKGA